MLQSINFSIFKCFFGQKRLITRLGDQSHLISYGCQAQIGIVLTKQQPVFRARGHHAIRLVRAFGNEIVDQRADIAARTLQYNRKLSFDRARRVDPRDKPLRGSLLVSRRAVKLPRAVQPSDRLKLQRSVHLQGIGTIVFDRIGIAHDLGAFKTDERTKHFVLYVGRKRGRKALNIHLLGVLAHRLYKQLVAFFFGEAHQFILDRRAVSRPRAVYFARIERASFNVFADNTVCFGIGIDDMARNLLQIIKKMLVMARAVGNDPILTGLLLKPRKIDRLTLDTRGRSRLETQKLDPRVAQRRRQALGGQKAVGSCLVGHVANKDRTLKVSPRADHRALARPSLAQACHHTKDLFFTVRLACAQLGDLGLYQAQIRGVFKHLFHQGLVFFAVGLNSLALYRRALSRIERTRLQSGKIGTAPHLATQRVDLVDKMPLGSSADRRVAGQIGDRFQRKRKKNGIHAHTRRRQRRLDPRVARTDHSDLRFANFTHEKLLKQDKYCDFVIQPCSNIPADKAKAYRSKPT